MLTEERLSLKTEKQRILRIEGGAKPAFAEPNNRLPDDDSLIRLHVPFQDLIFLRPDQVDGRIDDDLRLQVVHHSFVWTKQENGGHGNGPVVRRRGFDKVLQLSDEMTRNDVERVAGAFHWIRRHAVVD